MTVSVEDVERWSGGDFLRSGSGRPLLFYRGVPEEAISSPFGHRDGCPVFLTEDPDEAAGYGHVVTAAVRGVGFFEPRHLVYRVEMTWLPDAKGGSDLDASIAFLDHLVASLGRVRAEDLYHHVEGGSWSAIEHEVVQGWIRSNAYGGFRCWEGEGETLALYDPIDVMLIADRIVLKLDPDRSSLPCPGSISP